MGGEYRWKKITSQGKIPSGRIGHSMCTDGDGMIYVFGGVNEESGGTKYVDDFYRYDFYKKEWSEIPLTGSKPSERAFHTAVMYEGAVVIFGGCNGQGRFNEITLIHVRGEKAGHCEIIETQGDRPSTRYCHSAVQYNGRMVVFGGKCGGRSSNKRLSDMYEFCFREKRWSVVTTQGVVPDSRSAHTATLYGNKMLMFGGRDTEGSCCPDFYEFDLDKKAWKELARNPLLIRARHSAVVINNHLVIFGGWNGKKKLNDLCIIDLDSMQPQYFESDGDNTNLPCRRECHTTAAVGDTVVMFAGRFRGEFLHDVWEFPLEPPSLKYLLRSFIIRKQDGKGFPHLTRDMGLPEELVRYLEQGFKNGAFRSTARGSSNSIMTSNINVAAAHAATTSIKGYGV